MTKLFRLRQNSHKISTKEENKTVTPTSDRGLAGLPVSLKEAAKKEEVIQTAQVDGRALRKEAEKEKASANNSPPSPAVRTRRYAMEMRIQIESSPGMYSFPEEDTYGADFVIDTVNMAYPGCTGVPRGGQSCHSFLWEERLSKSWTHVRTGNGGLQESYLGSQAGWDNWQNTRSEPLA